MQDVGEREIIHNWSPLNPNGRLTLNIDVYSIYLLL